jgi:anthranilate phosphoribosyltransferase
MFRAVLANEQPDLQQGAFMAALTAKGETAEEIAGAWEAIYQLDTVKVFPHCSGPVVDNCGTGMDSFKTFNISTVAAIIAAAGGAHVARHGARGITSSCGTVDIAEALGVDVECTAEVVCRSIEEAGLGLFNGMSAHIHPKALGRILAQINFGTTLNIAASLASPVRPLYAVRGVSSRQMLRPVAEAMREIGYKRALVVHGFAGRGELGMDEASVCDTTYAVELDIAGTLKEFSTSPEQLGLPRHRADRRPRKLALLPLDIYLKSPARPQPPHRAAWPGFR